MRRLLLALGWVVLLPMAGCLLMVDQGQAGQASTPIDLLVQQVQTFIQDLALQGLAAVLL